MKLNRREFLETSGKAALGVGLGVAVADALATPARAQEKKTPPSEKIRMAAIGVGGQGFGTMWSFMHQPDVEMVAVADVHKSRLDRAARDIEKQYGKKPLATKDFREIMDRKDVDAVMISTPDHWHALPFIAACETGKDIFCEKPISHDIAEAKSMLGAARHYNPVVQINTWQRSLSYFRDAIDFARSGKMGKIAICRAWTCGGAGLGKNPIKEPPAELDWDFWLGPAAKAPYHDKIDPGEWRWYLEYGAGLTGDWGVHMIDIVLLGMNAWHPLEVSSYGGKLRCTPDDDRTAPDTQIAIYKFPDFILQWEVHVGGEGLDAGRWHGAEFIGEKGKLIIDRDGIIWNPYEKDYPGPESKNRDDDHMRNFLENVKKRGKCISDIETMYCTTVTCHLANLAYLRGKSIKWDGKKGEVVGDKEAMQLLSYRREYRKPWKLPVYKMT